MKRGKSYSVVGSEPWRRSVRRSVALVCAAAGTMASATGSATADPIVVASGILSASEGVDVPAPGAGILRRSRAVEGRRVREGEVLARVDAAEQQLEAAVVEQDLLLSQREAESDIRTRLAKKEHAVSKAELSRATSVNLDLPNTVSAKEIDRLRLAVERTELEIEHAGFERDLLELKIDRIEAQLRLAKHRADRMAVVSPLAGVVAEVDKRTGEWVNKGDTVLRVVRVDRLRLEGYVSVEDAVTGLVGRRVKATVRGRDDREGRPTTVAYGRVVFVSPEAEPVNSQVKFWAEIDNRQLRLRAGLTASVVILDETAPPARQGPGSRDPDATAGTPAAIATAEATR